MFLTRLCSALNQSKIEYAVVGGYAVALHGAVRATIDVDLIIGLTEESFVKSEETFKKLGLLPRIPVTAQQLFKFRTEYIQNKNLIAWSFYNPQNQAEQLDIVVTLDARKISTVTKTVNGLKIKVISKKDLIKIKKNSGRPQDLQDVAALEQIDEN
jgi:hypothetical protein